MVSAVLQSSSWKQGLRVSYPSHVNKENQKLTNSQQSRNTTIDRGKMQDNESINYGTTPFRELIKSMPGTVEYSVTLFTLSILIVLNYLQSSYTDLAMVVLDKCRKEYDSGEREYNYEFIEDFPDLYFDNKCPRFHSGKFLHYIAIVTHQILFIGTFVNREPTNESRPHMHRPLSQTVSQTKSATDATDHHEPTAQPCLNHPWGPRKYYYWNHPLQLMV